MSGGTSENGVTDLSTSQVSVDVLLVILMGKCFILTGSKPYFLIYDGGNMLYVQVYDFSRVEWVEGPELPLAMQGHCKV